VSDGRSPSALLIIYPIRRKKMSDREARCAMISAVVQTIATTGAVVLLPALIILLSAGYTI